MSVLHSTGLETMFAGLTQIRNDHLNAEHQIDEQLHCNHLATLTEGALETSINFSAMEDDVHADSMNYAGTAQGPPSPAESDWDNDETGDEGDPQSEGQPVSSNVYSAYARLCLYNNSHRHQNDQQTCETHYANMHVSLDMQLPTLIERYLEQKHNGFINPKDEELASCHWFQVTTVDIFALIAKYSKDLEVYHVLYPTQTLDFEAWASEELEYLKNVGTEPLQDALAVKYVEALELLHKCQETYEKIISDNFVSYNSASFTPDSGLSYASSQATKQGHVARRSAECTLQNQTNIIEELEATLGIEVEARWMPQSSKYQEVLKYTRRCQFIRTIKDLEGLVVQQLFKLSKANLSLMGWSFFHLDAKF
ncbi:hypothetical protein SCLCIDRAFT_25861 [Scleroderma citrinum Foug A]|uniref:Uncharacterized protein n=1 Tax=Scleroderma citrinum Foug A TaxID=1036808 RepID=A0A0C3DL04_9AGAM|nr:hypothetical protein SCLCIDRAFT_25861 [Scleroderma citrinum Foug A]